MTQGEAIKECMLEGEWQTFESLKLTLRHFYGIGISEAGVSARIRDLRKVRYGGYVVERRPTSRKGVFEYCLTPKERFTV
jgi:hypothetical protein